MSAYVKKDIHQSPDPRKRLGRRGEDTACCYLERHGFRIIERNIRCAFGELDIVALEGGSICFIEVKTRSSLKYGRPSLALSAKKKRTLRMLAEAYIKDHAQYRALRPRIDVLELVFCSDGKSFVNHIRAAL